MLLRFVLKKVFLNGFLIFIKKSPVSLIFVKFKVYPINYIRKIFGSDTEQINYVLDNLLIYYIICSCKYKLKVNSNLNNIKILLYYICN